ncbi:MAG: 5'-3' exonuclease H3TH domain-containing protein, partial [Acidobacteriota bacterium]
FGVRPGQIADYLGLAGDSVDNIPGVPGVGKKTASALLASFDSLEDLYSRLDEVPQLPIRGAKSLARKLAEHRGAAELSKRLATIVTDAETAEGVAKADLDRLELRRPDPALLEPWLEEHGFGSLAERLRVWPEAG